MADSNPAGPVATPKKPFGCGGCLGVIAVLFAILWFVGELTPDSESNDSFNGCALSMPSADFNKCVNREGIWAGIDDVP